MSETHDDPPCEGEILEDEFHITGMRTQKAFMLLESELDMLAWAPWFLRRSMIKRIKAETRFKEPDDDEPPLS